MKPYTGLYGPIAAREKCRADDDKVHLPTPKSGAQNQWYQNYALKLSISHFWLGLDDIVVEGQWKTENDEIQSRVSKGNSKKCV